MLLGHLIINWDQGDVIEGVSDNRARVRRLPSVVTSCRKAGVLMLKIQYVWSNNELERLWPRPHFWLAPFNNLYLGFRLAFFNGPFTAPFSFIFVFSLQLIQIKTIWVCWWRDSNRGSQVAETTSLATGSQATASLYLALSPEFFPRPRIQT